MVAKRHPPSPAKPPAMNPKIWSHLPEHLLDYALFFLSLKTFLKLTPTSKHFKSLLSSPEFISKHATSSFPFLLLSHPQFKRHFPLYNAVLTSWRTLPLPFPRRYPAPHLLSVSRGVLCFSLPYYPCFIISNLLSTSKKTIKFPAFDFDFDLVTLVCSSIGFKIFVLCSSSGSSNHTYVYDSITGQWSKFDQIRSILSNNCHQEGAFYNGSLCFATPDPSSIISFNLDTGVWFNRTILLAVELTFARLVSDGDKKMYLIGGIGQHGISRGIRIWELGDNEIDWVEIEILPDMICRKFMSICYHNYEQVYCIWHQGLICVCCYNWPEVLYYKVSRRTWHWLPKNPSLPEKWSFGFRWFPLFPQLHTFI